MGKTVTVTTARAVDMDSLVLDTATLAEILLQVEELLISDKTSGFGFMRVAVELAEKIDTDLRALA